MPRPPNVLIIMTDQQRGGTLLGDRRAAMPNLEALAARGTRFANARCPAPHCCPSRATFLTGLMPSQHGVWSNVQVPNALSRGLAPGTGTWSRELAAAGWRLAWSGKWHIDDVAGPADHGWEELLVTAGPSRGTAVNGLDWDGYRALAAEAPAAGPRRAGEVIRPGYPGFRLFGERENPFGDEDVVGAAEDWLRAHGGRRDAPWCLYVGTLGPHDPYIPPGRFLDLYPELPELPPSFGDPMADKPALHRRARRRFAQLSPQEHRETIRHYLAFCSYQDHLAGRLLAALAAAGAADDTVVLFTSDHGDYCGDHGLWCKGLPAFTGAYHIPLLAAGPGVAPGRVVEDFVGLEDVAPTLRQLAGLPASAPCAGASLLPFLAGGRPASWRDAWCTQSNGNELYGIQRIVASRDWHYVYNGFDEDELYDLRSDPHQLVNLARDPALDPVRDGLCARMWRHAYDHGDTCINNYILTALAPVGPGAAFTAKGT